MLTAREREVLHLLAQRCTHVEIARRLGISRYTVGHHVNHLFGKLGVHRAADAVRRGAELGLLEEKPCTPPSS